MPSKREIDCLNTRRLKMPGLENMIRRRMLESIGICSGICSYSGWVIYRDWKLRKKWWR